MGYGIPEEIIEEVRLRADIVETISEYVSLQRRGKNYLGLCPFHVEKTPSFNVNAEKQMFYCFGCHTGGNVFSFLMKKENWNFPEAVEYLARKHGISLPEKQLSQYEREEQRKRKRWEQIHEWAAGYFQEILLNYPEGEPGRLYLQKRGLDEQTINTFRLGYAPSRWDGLITALGQKGVLPAELVEAGLALEAERKPGETKARYYDRFRNRVMYTIIDSRQSPVAFGGRVLDDSMPKYLNSPETAFFSKGHHLYGMQKAYAGIRERGFGLLVEGYMDVIALQKAGFTNAVASLGTALTREQAKLLQRYTSKVTICYDSDHAGVQAALRAGEILQEVGLRVLVMSLPDAKDPDEYLKNHSGSDLKRELERAYSYIEFKFRTFTKEHPVVTIPEKADIVGRLAADILKIKSPVEREGYERFLSTQLGLTLEAVQREIASRDEKKPKKGPKREYSSQQQDISVKNRDNIFRNVPPDMLQPVSVPQGLFRAERTLLRLMWEQPRFIYETTGKLGNNFWQLPEHRLLFETLARRQQAPAQSEAELEVQSKVAALLWEDIDLSRPERLFADCIRIIESSKEEEKVTDLQTRMAGLEQSGDMAAAMALLREIGERLRRGEK